MKLSIKQKKFGEFYVACGNATEAAIKAGYSKKTARFIGAENLTKPNIAAYIAELQKDMQSKRILSAQQRQELLSNIARDGSEKTDTRIKAVDTLNKMTGEYVQQVNLGGDVGLSIGWSADE